MKREPLEAVLRDLERLCQTHRIYPGGHAQTTRAAELAARSLRGWGRPVRMSLIGEDLVVEDISVNDLGERCRILTPTLKANGWEGIRFAPSCEPSELLDWVSRAQSGVQGPYASQNVVAGSQELRGHGTAVGDGTGGWSDGYRAYLPDANRAVEDLGRARPEALELARQITRSIAGRLTVDNSLLAAVRALKKFDEYTFTHALNVSILVTALAQELGLSKGLCEVIGLGGLCHDVGKTQIPPEILNKPGRLTDDEREVINRHPVDGARALLALPIPVHALIPTIAYEHHMGADLGGYPKLPHGRPPHACALLVQVADVFDALRTIRAYRGTLTEIEAVNIMLADVRGGRLHPPSTAALLRVLGLLEPGACVGLADGVQAKIVGAPEHHDMAALVETDAGEILDLSDSAAPQISSFVAAPAT